MSTDRAEGPADSELVAAIRRGEDRAFEVLYHRYHRRIHAYVLGMVKDHGRAEDITQEVFVSALRRMRETDQALAFKPWLYQIAKNSCIDAFRRSKRAEEVSYDADDALAPSDHSRLVGSGPSPDAAVAAKQDLESLCGAFGGLSETHHEILVLRELEGLSYQEIGRRMGMSRPAVESTLFRARRRLSEEYDDIVSGARCQRIQGIIVTAASTRLGARDTRRLARHLAHCQPCRREALAAGLDRSLFTRPPVRERVARKVAAILPFPIFARMRRGADAAPPPDGSGRFASWTSQLPLLSEHLQSGWSKAAAGAALLVASVGTGVGVHQVTASSSTPVTPGAAARTSQPVAARHASAPTAKREALANPAKAGTLGKAAAATATPRKAAAKKHHVARHHPSSAADRATSAGGGSTHPATAHEDTKTASSDSGGSSRGGSAAKTTSGGGRHHSTVPKAIATPVGTVNPGTPSQTVTDTVRDAAQKTTDAVKQAEGQVGGAVNNATANTPVAPAVATVTGTVGKTVGDAADGVNKTVGHVTGGLDAATGGGG